MRGSGSVAPGRKRKSCRTCRQTRICLAQEGFEKLQPTSNALWPGSLVLSERWILVGLDASTTSLAQTSLSSPPPAGSIELPNDSYNGDEPRNLFVGPRFPERHFLFAVLALCDRQVDLDPYNAGQLRGDAIAVGWFIAEPPW
jgi:hypothetical protein